MEVVMLDLETLVGQFRDTLGACGRSERTADNYVYALRGFARWVEPRTLEGAVCDDILAYQRHLGSRGLSDSGVRVATYALRFFFREVLEHRDWDFARIPPPRRPRRLPEVPGVAEVEAVLAQAPSLKHRVALLLAFGCGLRTEEILHLQPRDIDSDRMIIRVHRGKGNKDRTVKLPALLLCELRACWRTYQPQTYLLEGRIPGEPLSASAVQRAARIAWVRAGLRRRITPRALRHAFATWLVEQGTNIRSVQALLGHQSLATTGLYTHLARTWLEPIKSPLEALKTTK
jgi:site-specific recombinase XerD